MNLPIWSRFPNPDFLRLLRILRQEASYLKTPFLELSGNLEAIACNTNELLIIPEDGKNDFGVWDRSG